MQPMRKLALLLAVLLMPAYAHASEPISALQADGEFHTVEGEVITIWYDTLLLEDNTGQVIVALAPETIDSLGLDSRKIISVTGQLKAGAFRPLVLINNETGESFKFNWDENPNAYPPIDESTIKSNSRYLLKK